MDSEKDIKEIKEILSIIVKRVNCNGDLRLGLDEMFRCQDIVKEWESENKTER